MVLRKKNLKKILLRKKYEYKRVNKALFMISRA